MKNPPKLIQEFLSKEWFSHLFRNFELQEEINKQKFPTYENTGHCRVEDQQFQTFKAEDIIIYNSHYFKSFIVEMRTQKIDLFEHEKYYCLNSTHTSQNSWSYSGSRMTNYQYIDEIFLTNLIITKQSDQFVGIRFERTTIEKTPKRVIETKLDLKGKIHFWEKHQTEFTDYSKFTEEELKEIRNWKNIEAAIKRQFVRASMSKWVENLSKCDIGDPQKQKVSSIYLNGNQKEKVKLMSNKSNDSRVRIVGEFRMYDDSSAILEKIEHIEPI